MTFKEYLLTADLLCIGERLKGGRYKPSAKTLRYSQLVGALKRKFGLMDVHAFGHLINHKKQSLSYNLTDRYGGGAKLPLKVELLTDVEGKVYISEGVSQIPDEFELDLGGMLSKGIGRCRLKFIKKVDSEKVKQIPGNLNTRIPIRAESREEMDELRNQGGTTSFLSTVFGIQAVKKPVFGYLFKPENEYTGHYELALFEESKVLGPDFLIEDKKMDEMENRKMDEIEEIMKEIKNHPLVQKCDEFANNFLNGVAEVFVDRGFGGARSYLLERKNRKNLKDQAEAVLAVLDIMRKSKRIENDLDIGGQIIKTIEAIKMDP